MLLAVCPRLKGRKNVGKIYLFFLFDYLVAFNINRDILLFLTIPELGGFT
jgi:hypothetical protein